MHLNISSGEWRPFRPGVIVLNSLLESGVEAVGIYERKSTIEMNKNLIYIYIACNV